MIGEGKKLFKGVIGSGEWSVGILGVVFFGFDMLLMLFLLLLNELEWDGIDVVWFSLDVLFL